MQRERANLEGAAVARMCKLRFDHIQAQLLGLGRVALPGHKFELGRRIDKPPDQPGGSNAIDMDTLARDPDSPGDIADPV
jgi:hypothetical protein